MLKTIIILSLCFVLCITNVTKAYSLTSHKEIHLLCETNVQSLSQQIMAHDWIKTPDFPWYASWAQFYSQEYLFSGGLGTFVDKYPDDPNPHLSFINPLVLHDDDEHGDIVVCRYKINNPELHDIEDILEMRAFTYLFDKSCFVSGYNMVTCEESNKTARFPTK